MCAYHTLERLQSKGHMDKHPSQGNMYGNAYKYQKRARAALPHLINLAKAGETITYGDLGEKLNWPKLIHYVSGEPLGSIWTTLYELQEEWKEQGHNVDIPCLTWIVVSKDTERPSYDDISQSEFEVECEKIFNFSLWTSVYEAIVEKILSQI